MILNLFGQQQAEIPDSVPVKVEVWAGDKAIMYGCGFVDRDKLEQDSASFPCRLIEDSLEFRSMSGHGKTLEDWLKPEFITREADGTLVIYLDEGCIERLDAPDDHAAQSTRV